MYAPNVDGADPMRVEQWCPEAQKTVKITLENVHKTRVGLEVGRVAKCEQQENCQHKQGQYCLLGKTLEGRFP